METLVLLMFGLGGLLLVIGGVFLIVTTGARRSAGRARGEAAGKLEPPPFGLTRNPGFWIIVSGIVILAIAVLMSYVFNV